MSVESFELNPDLGAVAPLGLFGLPEQTQYKVAKRFNPTAALKAICLDPEANPLAVRTAMDEATNQEWQDWEPEMLRDFLNLPEDEQRVLDKLMAVQVALTNQDVFTDWDLFNHVCTAFNHRRCNFGWLDRPDMMELAWGCICLRGLNGEHQFGPGVERFIIACMLEQGLTYFPWTGGEGIHLCRDPYIGITKGLVNPALCKVADDLKTRWENRELQELDPSDVNDNDALATQLSTIVNCQAYIRGQKSSNPGVCDG